MTTATLATRAVSAPRDQASLFDWIAVIAASIGCFMALLDISIVNTALLSVMMIAFAWPASRSAVHDIPLAVAGPPTATSQVTQRLTGHFDVTVVADTAAAERLILDREVYGAIDLSTGRPQLIVASAASPAIAQALQQAAQSLSGTEPAVPVRDLSVVEPDIEDVVARLYTER